MSDPKFARVVAASKAPTRSPIARVGLTPRTETRTPPRHDQIGFRILPEITAETVEMGSRHDPRREPEPGRFPSGQMRAVRASTGTRDAASVSRTLEAAGSIQSVLVRATLQAARAMRTGDYETARVAFEELDRHRVISKAAHDSIDSCVSWWLHGGADRV